MYIISDINQKYCYACETVWDKELKKPRKSGKCIGHINSDNLLTPNRYLSQLFFLESSDPSSLNVLSVLLESGAEVNAKDVEGWSSLMWAIYRYNDSEILSFLIEAGADVNAKSITGVTPLMIASVYTTDPEVLNVLLKAGAEVNARDEKGWTPLMWAAFRSTTPEVPRTLIKAGIDVTIPDNDGFTAIPMVLELWPEDTELVTILKEAAITKGYSDFEGFE